MAFRGDLDAGAYVTKDRGGIEQDDGVSGVRERVSRGEVAEVCASNDDVETEGGAVAAVERWDLFEGNIRG